MTGDEVHPLAEQVQTPYVQRENFPQSTC